MYENIGQKLKTIAKVILALGVIGGIIGFFVCVLQLFNENAYSYSSFKEFYVTGIVASVLSILGSIVSSLICYGIGEAAENSSKSLQKQIEIEKKISELNTVKKDSQIKAYGTVHHEHQWICQGCRNMISQNPCPFCGKGQPSFNLQTDENQK